MAPKRQLTLARPLQKSFRNPVERPAKCRSRGKKVTIKWRKAEPAGMTVSAPHFPPTGSKPGKRRNTTTQNLHNPRSALALKHMIPRVKQMASPLRLVPDHYTRAGCVYEQMASGEPANRGLGITVVCSPLATGVLAATRGSSLKWRHSAPV